MIRLIKAYICREIHLLKCLVKFLKNEFDKPYQAITVKTTYFIGNYISIVRGECVIITHKQKILHNIQQLTH